MVNFNQINQQFHKATTLEKINIIPVAGTLTSAALVALKILDAIKLAQFISPRLGFIKNYSFTYILSSIIPLIGTITGLFKLAHRGRVEAQNADALAAANQKLAREEKAKKIVINYLLNHHLAIKAKQELQKRRFEKRLETMTQTPKSFDSSILRIVALAGIALIGLKLLSQTTPEEVPAAVYPNSTTPHIPTFLQFNLDNI